MWPDMDVAFSKLMNPRMRMGITVLQALLAQLKGPIMRPREIRDLMEDIYGEKMSKQSITNAARRLQELYLLHRPIDGGYAVRYGYLISILLGAMMDLTRKIEELEDEIESLKKATRSQ
ncbi:MAG: hypothetical protein ACTSV8_09540 [Candidatus Thorarchaeota archaeon]